MIAPRTVDRVLREAARAFADRTFLTYVEDGTAWTYRELDRRVSRAANVLARQGIGRGDVVSLFLRNQPAFFPAWLGAVRAGGVANPINLGLEQNVERIGYMLRKARARLFIMEKRFAATAAAVKEACPEVRISFVDDDAGDFNWRRELEKAPDAFPETEGVGPGDPFQMIFTSGTTGLPKAVVQRHEMIEDAFCLSDHFAHRPDDVFLCVLPFFHVNAQYTSFFPALRLGARLVLFEKFSASRFFPTIEAEKVSHVSVVPSLLTRLLAHGVPSPRERPKSLRFIICGAAPLSAELHRRFMEASGVPVANGWGMTETGCWGLHSKLDDVVPGSMGRPLSINEVAIVDSATGELLPAGETGALVVRGRNIFQAYFDAPEATAQAFRFGGGWFDTGDEARVDPETGHYFFVGRGSVDTGKVDGEFVNFLALDEKLWSLPGVQEVCCVGVPDPIRGSVVAACVVRSAGSALTEQDVLDYCRKQGLAGYEMPRRVLFVDAVPKGDTGKIQRRVMTEQAARKLAAP